MVETQENKPTVAGLEIYGSTSVESITPARLAVIQAAALALRVELSADVRKLDVWVTIG